MAYHHSKKCFWNVQLDNVDNQSAKCMTMGVFFSPPPKTLSDMKMSLLVALGTSFLGVYLSVGLATSPLPPLAGRPISHTHCHLATSS